MSDIHDSFQPRKVTTARFMGRRGLVLHYTPRLICSGDVAAALVLLELQVIGLQL